MPYAHDQGISLNTFIFFAMLDSGFFSKAITSNRGAIPRTMNKIIPGIRKLSKGIFYNTGKGIPNISPESEIIKREPPGVLKASVPKTIEKKISNEFKYLIYLGCLSLVFSLLIFFL